MPDDDIHKGSTKEGETLLVADIGGTNARFALANPNDKRLSQFKNLPTKDYAGIIAAANEYLGQILGKRPTQACIAVACPVWGDAVSLTNNDWAFSIEDVQSSLKLKHLKVVNDFKALAAGVPFLAMNEKVQIGKGHSIDNHPISVIGPGTGLGVATIIQNRDNHIILDGEGGHVGFAPENQREVEILQVMQKDYGRVSAERILSGDGMVALYHALSEIRGIASPSLTAADIVEQAKSGSNAHSIETINVFCSILGSFAGDTAMTLNSQGGVYIGGGIVPRIADLLEKSPFRQRFENKGRTSSLIRNVPTFLMVAEQTALSGAVHLFLDDFRNS